MKKEKQFYVFTHFLFNELSLSYQWAIIELSLIYHYQWAIKELSLSYIYQWAIIPTGVPILSISLASQIFHCNINWTLCENCSQIGQCGIFWNSSQQKTINTVNSDSESVLHTPLMVTHLPDLSNHGFYFKNKS